MNSFYLANASWMVCASFFVLSMLPSFSCGSESVSTVVVQMRTDLVPREEFEKVRLTLRSLDSDVVSLRLDVNAEDDSYIEAKNLGEFPEVPAGRYQLSVAPYLAGTDTLASPYLCALVLRTKRFQYWHQFRDLVSMLCAPKAKAVPREAAYLLSV